MRHGQEPSGSRYRSTLASTDLRVCQDYDFDARQAHENGHIYGRIAAGQPDAGCWVRLSDWHSTDDWKAMRLLETVFDG